MKERGVELYYTLAPLGITETIVTLMPKVSVPAI